MTNFTPTWALDAKPCINCGAQTQYRTIVGGAICYYRKECRGKPHPYGYTPREIKRVMRNLSTRPGRQNWRGKP